MDKGGDNEDKEYHRRGQLYSLIPSITGALMMIFAAITLYNSINTPGQRPGASIAECNSNGQINAWLKASNSKARGDLNSYLLQYGGCKHTLAANMALSLCHEVTEEIWEASKPSQIINAIGRSFIPKDAVSKKSACATAEARAQEIAVNNCRDLVANAGWSNAQSSVAHAPCKCDQNEAISSCTVEMALTCDWKAKVKTSVEVCG